MHTLFHQRYLIVARMTIPSFLRDDTRSNVESSPMLEPHLPFVSDKIRRHGGVRSTIQHWQLRDLLACTKQSIIHVLNGNVLSFDLQAGTSKHLLKDLPFSPTSMTVSSNNFLAVGGQRSQLLVRQLDSNWFAQTSVGGSINNALNITTSGGETRLYVANNDESIKVYNLPDLRRVTSIVMSTPVNYTSTSPDGKHLLAVGDSSSAYLFRITDGTTPAYHRIATLPVSNDANFSCDWSHNGEQFAVASQDGTVCVWDIRMVATEQGVRSNATERPTERATLTRGTLNQSGSIIQRELTQDEDVMETDEDEPWTLQPPRRRAALPSVNAYRLPRLQPPPTMTSSSKKLATFHTSQHPRPSGAARSVKFSKCGGTMDLMVVTEHTGYVNIVDARTFRERQVVRVVGTSPPDFLGAEPHITGVTFSPFARSLFVGTLF